MTWHAYVSAALGAAALGLGSGLHAAGIFLPVDSGSVAARVARAATHALWQPNEPVVAAPWERRVRVARHKLAIAREDVETTGAARLLLNVREGGRGGRLDVVVERSAPTRWGYSLSGRVVGGGAGFVTIVVHEDVVRGSIWTPNVRYEIVPLGGGIHALRDVTNVPRLECGGTLPSEASKADQGHRDNGSVVDILVVWTPAAEELAGGEAEVLSRIHLLVAYANDAFERSGALVSLKVVGAERVEYSEGQGLWIDLNRLAASGDGYLDRVHDRRDILGADLVYLLLRTADPNIGGLAQLLGSFSVGGGQERLFAHEVGHNLGLRHDRFQAGPETFAHGFATGGILCERTIMTYPDWCRWARRLSPWRTVPFYSSPWRYSPGTGRPLGVSRYSNVRGPGGPADAVLAINRNRHKVANFRPSRDAR